VYLKLVCEKPFSSGHGFNYVIIYNYNNIYYHLSLLSWRRNAVYIFSRKDVQLQMIFFLYNIQYKAEEYRSGVLKVGIPPVRFKGICGVEIDWKNISSVWYPRHSKTNVVVVVVVVDIPKRYWYDCFSSSIYIGTSGWNWWETRDIYKTSSSRSASSTPARTDSNRK